MAKVRKKTRRGANPSRSGPPQNADKRPHIALLTAVWRRVALTEVVFAHYAQMTHDVKDRVRLSLVAVGSEGYVSKRRADRYGWTYVEYPNAPLGAKWNAGLPAVRALEADAILIVGSDDLLNAPVIETYAKALREGVRYMGLQDLYFYDQPSDRTVHWPGYTGKRAGESAGLGRCIHRSYLDAVDWTLWEDTREHGLDGSMRTTLAPLLDEPARAPERRAYRCGDHGMMAVDVKTRTNMWQFSHFADHQGLPAADTQQVLDGHFSKAIVDGIRRLTPDGSTFVDAPLPEADLTEGDPQTEADRSVELGEDEYAKGALRAAEGFFRNALLFVPDHARALNDLGVVLSQQGDIELAERALMRAMLMGDPTEAALNLIEIELGRQRVHSAVRLADAASRLGASGDAFNAALHQIAEILEQAG
jgi:hypothetical protein